MSDVHLGSMPPVGAERDATHVAVVPMVAAERMKPGTHCGVVSPGQAGPTNPNIGIVDPFLFRTVDKGELFYLCLYPRSVTGLRHVYEHPVLDNMKADEAVQSSEKWLRSFCANNDCPDYGIVMDRIVEVENGEDGRQGRDEEHKHSHLHFDSIDAHGKIPAEFWDHVEAVLGRKLKYRPSYFSCSC